MSRKVQSHEDRFKDQLAESNADLESYDAFLENFQSLGDPEDAADSSSEKPDVALNVVETLAKSELQKLLGGENAAQSTPNESFKNLGNAAFMTNTRGILTAVNPSASSTFNARPEMSVEFVGIRLNDGRSVKDALHAIKMKNEPSDGLHLVQAEMRETNQQLSLAILQLPDDGYDGGHDDIHNGGQFLIIVVDAPWGEAAQELVRTKFDLTETETDIVSGFATGVSLKKIAADRGRSYATVRNQFQSVMKKTGCTSQPDLLRLLLGVSFLLSNLQSISKAPEDPHEKRIELLRPKGRFLDVSLHGDFEGTPVICLPSLFGQPTTPSINKALYKAGVLLIAVARPGFGQTSPEVKGDNLNATLAADMGALLDSMGIEKCVFMGRASASRPLVNLGLNMPDRISKCLMINGMVPRPFVQRVKVSSKWTKALMSAAKLAPSFAGFILGTGKRIMFSTGVEPFIKKMYCASALDVATVEDPQVSGSIRRGVSYVTNQGLDAGIRDMIDGFEDWSDEVAHLKVPIVMMHGEHDPNVPIQAVRDFCDAFSASVRLIYVADGGGLLNYTHVDLILAEILKDQAA